MLFGNFGMVAVCNDAIFGAYLFQEDCRIPFRAPGFAPGMDPAGFVSRGVQMSATVLQWSYLDIRGCSLRSTGFKHQCRTLLTAVMESVQTEVEEDNLLNIDKLQGCR